MRQTEGRREEERDGEKMGGEGRGREGRMGEVYSKQRREGFTASVISSTHDFDLAADPGAVR